MAFRDLHVIGQWFAGLDGTDRYRHKLAEMVVAREAESLARLKAWSADPANRARLRECQRRYDKKPHRRAAKAARARKRNAYLREHEPETWRALVQKTIDHYHRCKTDPTWLANRRARAAEAKRRRSSRRRCP